MRLRVAIGRCLIAAPFAVMIILFTLFSPAAALGALITLASLGMLLIGEALSADPPPEIRPPPPPAPPRRSK